MEKIWAVLVRVFQTPQLKEKLWFTIGILVFFRVLAHITIPGVDLSLVQQLLTQSGEGSVLRVFALLSGGALENFSIVLMGLTPYINASIIMQLLTVVVPQLENLKKEGDSGQRKIQQYTRLLTVPLAFFQSYGMLVLLNRFSPAGPIVDTADLSIVLPMMITITAGTMLLVWLGELISERGVGNGISVLIFAGIVATVPQQIAGTFQASTLPVILAVIAATIALTLFVVYVSEGERRVPVVYTGRQQKSASKTFLPLKINQAGMIPIIFAISLISFPAIMAQFMLNGDSATVRQMGEFIITHLNPGSPSAWYLLFYGLLIFGFTYFYVSIVFEPHKMAENIQKRNGYVPGYRPGGETEDLLAGITVRLCFWGGAFLSFVALFPMFFERWIGGGANSISLFISGAGIIIVVSVVLDLIRRINAQLVSHDYNRL